MRLKLAFLLVGLVTAYPIEQSNSNMAIECGLNSDLNIFVAPTKRHSDSEMSSTPAHEPASFIPGSCSGTIRKRKDVRDLSQDEVANFIKAFITITNNGQLQSLISIHTMTPVHFTPYFLPWHRIFVRQFEDLMQAELGPEWALPYWDWSIDSQHPDKSVIFTSNFFGQNDQSGGTGEIINSLMKNFEAQFPYPHPLTRAFKGPMGVFTASSILSAQYIVEASSYSTFSQNFENIPHAIVHSEIGGDMGDMNAPNDIIFWLHHSFVDKVWYEWQSLGSNINKYDGMAYGSRFTNLNSDSIIPNFNVPVSSVLDATQLCYTYVPPSQSTLDESVDFGLSSIAAPKTIPISWLNQSPNANITHAHNLLSHSQAITNHINQLALNSGSRIPVQRFSDQLKTKNSAFSIVIDLKIITLLIILSFI